MLLPNIAGRTMLPNGGSLVWSAHCFRVDFILLKLLVIQLPGGVIWSLSYQSAFFFFNFLVLRKSRSKFCYMY